MSKNDDQSFDIYLHDQWSSETHSLYKITVSYDLLTSDDVQQYWPSPSYPEMGIGGWDDSFAGLTPTDFGIVLEYPTTDNIQYSYINTNFSEDIIIFQDYS